MVVAYLFSAVLPLFYFALWRNEGTPRFSKRLRFASLAGALAGVVVMAAGLPLWSEATMPKMLLSDLATLACVLLLIAFFSGGTDRSPADAPVSSLLRVMTRVAVIGGAIWLTFNLLALVLTVLQRTEADMMEGAIRTLLEQFCLFTAPYIVYLRRDTRR